MTIDRSAERSPMRARVCMPSQRAFRRDVAWCSMYEFEDVISSVDGVDRLDLEAKSGFALRQRVTRSVVFRQVWRQLNRLNPGLQPTHITQDYDLFAFFCITPSELLYLNAIHGWKERCRKKVCFIFEIWAGMLKLYEPMLRLLESFDHVFIEFDSSVKPVQDLIGVPCSQLSPAPDALRFSPYPNPPARCIDVYSIGRRVEAMHKSLLSMAQRREIFYIYDTIPGLCMQPKDHREHRELYSNIAKRSRFFVTYPAKVDAKDETYGISEPGMRFYEGIATGAVLVGQRPTCETFKKEFHWKDSALDIGERVEDLLDVMEKFKREPEQYEELSRRNAMEALKGHDVSHRWAQILKTIGMEPVPALSARQQRLNELAEMAEHRVLV